MRRKVLNNECIPLHVCIDEGEILSQEWINSLTFVTILVDKFHINSTVYEFFSENLICKMYLMYNLGKCTSSGP